MSDRAVKLHVLKGPRVPETAGHPFLCEHFRGTLTGSECLRRQTLRIKAPAQAKDKSTRVPQHLEYCAGGKCDQGAEIAKKFPDWKPEERPPMDWAAQWTAKRRHDGVGRAVAGTGTERGASHDQGEPMMEMRPCSVEHCTQKITPANKSGKCRWCACKIPLGSPAHGRLSPSQKPKNGKPGVAKLADLRGAPAIVARKKEIPGVKSSAERLTGQDEFDLMIAIRDSFRKLSEPGKLYVLAALELRK